VGKAGEKTLMRGGASLQKQGCGCKLLSLGMGKGRGSKPCEGASGAQDCGQNMKGRKTVNEAQEVEQGKGFANQEVKCHRMK